MISTRTHVQIAQFILHHTYAPYSVRSAPTLFEAIAVERQDVYLIQYNTFLLKRQKSHRSASKSGDDGFFPVVSNAVPGIQSRQCSGRHRQAQWLGFPVYFIYRSLRLFSFFCVCAPQEGRCRAAEPRRRHRRVRTGTHPSAPHTAQNPPSARRTPDSCQMHGT